MERFNGRRFKSPLSGVGPQALHGIFVRYGCAEGAVVGELVVDFGGGQGLLLVVEFKQGAVMAGHQAGSIGHEGEAAEQAASGGGVLVATAKVIDFKRTVGGQFGRASCRGRV